jgi:hypothetical protein
MLWGCLTTMAIIAIHIVDPCRNGLKVRLKASIFPSLRTRAKIPDEMLYK